MMKRLIGISLITLFLAGIVGLRYDAHYCGGKLVASSFSTVPHDLSCGMAGMDQEDDCQLQFRRHCCDNDHLSFEITDDYNSNSSLCFDLHPAAIIPVTFDYAFIDLILLSRYEFIGYSPPPSQHDIILFNQTFLI